VTVKVIIKLKESEGVENKIISNDAPWGFTEAKVQFLRRHKSSSGVSRFTYDIQYSTGIASLPH
jgi:hypothetical protein